MTSTGVGGPLGRETGEAASTDIAPANSTEQPAVQDVERPARMLSTEDPHVFLFEAEDLEPGQMYHMSVDLPSGLCGRVFWRAAARGLVVAGSTGVLVEGFAANSTLEVRDLETGDWLGMDDLRFDNPFQSTRTLRWRTALDGVVAGELQISYDAFPIGNRIDPCAEPDSGILYRQRILPRDGEWTGTIDFGTVLSPLNLTLGIAALPGRLSAAEYASLRAGHPVYVRVIPVRPAGPACNNTPEDGIHGWVILARVPRQTQVSVPPPPPQLFVPLSSAVSQVYLPPRFDPLNAPGYFDLGYKVIKVHQLPLFKDCISVDGQIPPALASDPLGCQVVMKGSLPGGTILQPGPNGWFKITLTWSSGGGGSFSFSNFVTGFVNFVGYAVDALHNLTEEIKNAIVKVVVQVVSVLPGNPCGSYPDTCQQVVAAGLQIGLTAMGLPPSIPNWDQLKQQGVEYLAAEIASQTGAPQPLIDHAMDAAELAIEQMTAHRTDGAAFGYDWVIPYGGFDPAARIVGIRKQVPSISPFLVIDRASTGLHKGGSLPVPTRFPSSNVLPVPMIMQPNLDGIQAPLCISDKLASPSISCQPSLLPAPLCIGVNHTYDHPEGVYTFTDCATVGWPAIYYRDHWVADKLDTTPCTTIFEFSHFDFFGISFPAPLPPFLDGAKLTPTQSHLWTGPLFVQPGCP